jgi:hypothetical protein
LQCCVFHRYPEVSEENISSIFRAEEYAIKEPAETGGKLLVSFLNYCCLLHTCFMLAFGQVNSSTMKTAATCSPEMLTFIGLHDVISQKTDIFFDYSLRYDGLNLAGFSEEVCRKWFGSLT